MSSKSKKKPCPRGKSCPFQNEGQHVSEFSHDNEPSKKGRSDSSELFPGKAHKIGAPFIGAGYRLGGSSAPLGRAVGIGGSYRNTASAPTPGYSSSKCSTTSTMTASVPNINPPHSLKRPLVEPSAPRPSAVIDLTDSQDDDCTDPGKSSKKNKPY